MTENIPEIKITKLSSNRRKELHEELESLNKNIQNYIARRDGGKNSIGQILPPIEKELALANQKIAILKITHDEFVLVNPQFKFQLNSLWIADQKAEISAKISNMMNIVSNLEEQKRKVNDELPSLEKRQKELEEKLKR